MEDKKITSADFVVDLKNILAHLMVILDNQSIIQSKLTGEDKQALSNTNHSEVSRILLKLIESLPPSQ